MGQSAATSAKLNTCSPSRESGTLDANTERRLHLRVNLALNGGYLLPSGEEQTCSLINISAGGAFVQGPAPGEIGAQLVIYLTDVGRFDAKIVRIDEDGFAIRFANSSAKVIKTANALTWLLNKDHCPNLEMRRHQRTPQSYSAGVTLDDGTQIQCDVLDISLSGASLALDPRPNIGDLVILGRTKGRVVRHHSKGVGVEFLGVEQAAPPLFARP